MKVKVLADFNNRYLKKYYIDSSGMCHYGLTDGGYPEYTTTDDVDDAYRFYSSAEAMFVHSWFPHLKYENVDVVGCLK